MSHTEHTNEFIQSGNGRFPQLPDELTCTFRFGKTDHDYCKIKHEPIEKLEEEENDRLLIDDNLLSTAAANAAIMKIKSELKFLCSLKVRKSDGSPISVFNTDNSSSNYTTLEPSFELPIEDTLFLQELLNNPQIPSTLDDDNWPTDFPFDSLDQILTTDSNMTFKDHSDIPMEQNDDYFQHIGMTTEIPSTSQDETTSSSGSASDENERDDINRRGLKKSGGPLRKLARFGNKQVIKYSDEYHDRRIKNNEAVKKSRMKAKEKQKETESKMTILANENRSLNDRLDLLMKELQVLKSLYKELNQDLPTSAVKALERVNVR
jgi:CCAAT/enhancer binding protein (C/EBP)